MAIKAVELALYLVRFSTTPKNLFDTHVSVEGDTQGSMDEATDLAEQVRDDINADTGESYVIVFVKCIGTNYIWKNVPGP